MIKEINASNKTLLVNGPASVCLVSGEAETLGAPLKIGETIVIRDGKRAPFYVEKTASFDITHGRESTVEEADGNTVPASWQRAAEETLAMEKPTVVMIIGEADSGKTSLCTFLANIALKAQRKVAIIDSDLGQSDIGSPTTIGLAYINRFIKDLFHVKADDVCFVGRTSPGGAEEHVADCIAHFKRQILERNRNFLVINTDGWVDGEEAVRYKVMLAETLAPNKVIVIQQEKELDPILSKLKNQALVVEPPTAVKKRDREGRKALRELGYKKYLRNAKVEAFPLSWMRIDGVHSSPKLFLTDGRFKKIEEALGIQPLYCEETNEAIRVVLKTRQRLDFEQLRSAEEILKKKVRVMWRGDEKGLIVGLHDEKSKFLGIGVMCGIDYRRKVMKISTPVAQGVATVHIGNVRLDDDCREIGTATAF